MPGLLRGVARTAVIAGTATHVSNNVSRRQAQRWAAEEQGQQMQAEQPVQTVAPSQDDEYAELQKLANLRDQGIITSEDFELKKKQILGL